MKAHSRTVNLDIETRGAIPGEVAYTMAALAIHGYEPVTYRYFAIEPDGKLRWLTDDDIAQLPEANRNRAMAMRKLREIVKSM